MDDFRPTHEITLTNRKDGARRAIPVMLVDGVAYTEQEWEDEATADWECDSRLCTADMPSNGWTFQGGPYPGHTISVRTLPEVRS